AATSHAYWRESVVPSRADATCVPGFRRAIVTTAAHEYGNARCVTHRAEGWGRNRRGTGSATD
ncbi:MAG: hypothetical protein ABI877_13685, partial [Gemmatimonadaceae bacterium]